MRILILWLLPLFGLTQTNYSHYLREYTAAVGAHDFKPSGVPRLFWGLGGRSTASAAVRFDASAWFSWRLPDGSVDADIHDWNYKLFGCSPLFEKHNRNGIMFAARPTADSMFMELCFYQNVEFEHIAKSLKVFDLRDVFSLVLELKRFKKGEIVPCASAYDSTNNLLWYVEAPTAIFKWRPAKEIWFWFGGANNAEGKYGGVTSQRTTLYGYKIN